MGNVIIGASVPPLVMGDCHVGSTSPNRWKGNLSPQSAVSAEVEEGAAHK